MSDRDLPNREHALFAAIRKFFHRFQWCNKQIDSGSFCSAACEARAIDDLAYGA